MSHDDRIALIYAPFSWRVTSFATHYPCSYPWGGTIVAQRPLITDVSGGNRASEVTNVNYDHKNLRTGNGALVRGEGLVLTKFTAMHAEMVADAAEGNLHVEEVE